MDIQLIRQSTRTPHPFFLRRNPNNHCIQSWDEGVYVASLELGNRRQKANSVLKLVVNVIRLAKLNTEVRSPAIARRHGLILGSTTPKRVSMNLMSDV